MLIYFNGTKVISPMTETIIKLANLQSRGFIKYIYPMQWKVVSLIYILSNCKLQLLLSQPSYLGRCDFGLSHLLFLSGVTKSVAIVTVILVYIGWQVKGHRSHFQVKKVYICRGQVRCSLGQSQWSDFTHASWFPVVHWDRNQRCRIVGNHIKRLLTI